MKRLRIATKLALAVVPIGLVALIAGALVSWSFLEEARAEERVARAGEVALDAMNALSAVATEQSAVLDVALGSTTTDLASARITVDTNLENLAESVERLVTSSSGGASGIASGIVTDSRALTGLAEQARAGDPLAESTSEIFDDIGGRLISIVTQSTLYFGDEAAAREGRGATALARAAFASFQQERLISRFSGGTAIISVEELNQRLLRLETTVSDWLSTAEESSPTVNALNLAAQVLDEEVTEDLGAFPASRDNRLVDAADDIISRVSTTADAEATTARNQAITVGSVVLAVLIIAGIASLIIGRSMVRRVRSVTESARHIADVDLPRMVDALRDPRGELVATAPRELDQTGPDEVSELARSFTTLHGTLVDVANRQMDILRRGVSEIFVTLARRNRSLIDRQLALIDELESSEEDPEILGGYYKLDHLATRMRRNAESLLVLAGTKAPRLWGQPLDMGEVVRAALGEVDDYQRVDVLAVEPARLTGRAVTDLSHLMSELLDNATQFSPPSERVRVTGLFDDHGYIITIADNGLGISESRLGELNRLMEEPPVLGLALDPTLGMYVVARLAHQHGIKVKLVAGVPGTTVRITIPRDLLEIDDGSQAPGLGEGVDVIEETASVEEPAVVSPETPRTVTIPPHAFQGRARHADEGNSAHPYQPDDAAEPAPKQQPAGPTGDETSPTTPATGPPSDGALPRRTPTRPATMSPRRSAPTSGDKTLPAPAPAADATPPSGDSAPPKPISAGPARPPRSPVPSRKVDSTANPPTTSPDEADDPTGRREEASARPAAAPERRPARPVDTPQSTNPPASPSRASTAGPELPTRTPGTSFQDAEGSDAGSAASKRGAAGIRDALVGYRIGRDTAARPQSEHAPVSHQRKKDHESETGDEK